MPDGRLIATRLIFWLLFFSAAVTAIIVHANIGKEMERRHHYAVNLSNMANSSNERVMNTMLTDFKSPLFPSTFERFVDSASAERIKDSLVRGNITSYQNMFKTRVYTFNAEGQALYNKDTIAFNTLNTIINTPQAKPTSIPGLYTYNVSFDQFNYIFKREIMDTALVVKGYVFIVVTPKDMDASGLEPQLFSAGQDNGIGNSAVYSYAVYDSLQLISRHNDNSFVTLLKAESIPVEEFEVVDKKGYNELWYRAGMNKVVIIARKDNFFIAAITLFSYMFCAFLLLTAFFWLLNAFIRSRFNKKKWKEYWQLSIRNQVHATVIFVSALSFLVIGLATVFFFKNRYENNKREELSNAMQLIEKEIRGALGKIVAFDDAILVGDPLNRPVLDSIVPRMAEIHGMDINLYDMKGNLQYTSTPPIYDMGVFSKKMDPEAYFNLNKVKVAQFFKKEQIGKLSYMSNYVPVADDRGVAYAYLNVPYFKSGNELKQEISSFFVAIINLNAFIFLIAGIVALFIANRITRSFSFISDKMRDVNLGKMNEAITWKRNDEIGNLVNEYNKMVAKLDDSAAALAKSEREGAWREMARQVAHEIKNPLTPMKLSLQYLQKAIKEGASNVQELSASVSQTLVEQIDHLSQIAGEFSQFANIGNPKKEWFDLNETLRHVVLLHMSENLQINWQAWQQPIMIHADRTQFNRLFTNLLQNAIQSIPEGRMPVIGVKNYVTDGRAMIEVSDNGSGIPETMQAQIFTPNFTTKTSGTGLGLAMCKGIVEQAKGQIWFATIPDQGTIFYVSLPLGSE
jgi:two-component system, NtrC family, nitrogen regulation sensor histidine kinase NtrY